MDKFHLKVFHNSILEDVDYEYLIQNYNSIYIQGSSGCGKTKYLLQHLKTLDYQYKIHVFKRSRPMMN